MTTPTFATSAAAFSTVRYYTALDPYYYTIDNRPLTDLATNEGVAGSAADAGRISAMMVQLENSARGYSSYGYLVYAEGLYLSFTGATAAIVSPGALFHPLATSASDSSVIEKQASNLQNQTFAINTVTLTGAQSCYYVIEYKAADYSGSTTGVPVYDNTNIFLPSSMISRNLQLQVVAGTAATTGSETIPGVTAGWTQLYVIKILGPTAGQSLVNISYPTGTTVSTNRASPHIITSTAMYPSSSSFVAYADTNVIQMANAATQGATFNLTMSQNGGLVSFVPYKPIYFKLTYAPTVSSNNFVVQLKYAILYTGNTISPISYTTATSDTIAAGTADQLQVAILTNGIIPTYTTIGGPQRLAVIINRLGSDGADTNTGSLNLLNVEMFQNLTY